MDIITLDFETYYDTHYSLKKLPTEEYIRHPEFQVIGVGIKLNGGPTDWLSGTHEQLKKYLQDNYDWDQCAQLGHNNMFDAAILSWVFNIHPKVLLDTQSMARAVCGVHVSTSLDALVQRYRLGHKGTEVVKAKGLRREDFYETQLEAYGDYCVNDVELTYKLFQVLSKDFPKPEMQLIDLTLRMFTEPVLELDEKQLKKHHRKIKDRKDQLLSTTPLQRKHLMSNPMFAKTLIALGATPPTKVSPRTGKETYAFAKTDPGMQKLLAHPNRKVRAVVNARIGIKSTIEETRTQRFLGVASRGLMPVPLKYYAAHTGRWGGSDAINLQNLPSRGQASKGIKLAIRAPEGHTIVDTDSSAIEARVLAWLAGQSDLVTAFHNKEDTYVQMAARIYHKWEEDVTEDERFIGKGVILGCGYGMGHVRFAEQMRSIGVDMSDDEAKRIIDLYRGTYPNIPRLWKQGQRVLEAMNREETASFGAERALEVLPMGNAILLPSGLLLRYPELSASPGKYGMEFTYKGKDGITRIHGPKCVENVCQALARIIIGEQMLKISARYRVTMTVHDSVVCSIPTGELDEAVPYIQECMKYVPEWAKGLPLDCETKYGPAYGDVVKWEQ